jgi:hypothetical protein
LIRDITNNTLNSVKNIDEFSKWYTFIVLKKGSPPPFDKFLSDATNK